MLQLSAQARERLIAAARAAYPEESCGVLVGRPGRDVVSVEQTVPTRNASADRRRDRYVLDPDDFVRADGAARAAGLDIIGIWHSHPDHPAEPSETDRRAGWEGWSYLIAAVESGEVTALRSWRLVGAGFVEEEVT